MILLSVESFVYNGEVQKPEVQMIYKEEAVDPDKYTVIYSDENSENAGTYTVTIMMKIGSGFTTEPCEAEYTIRKAGGVLRPSSFLVRQRSFWALRLFGAPKTTWQYLISFATLMKWSMTYNCYINVAENKLLVKLATISSKTVSAGHKTI